MAIFTKDKIYSFDEIANICDANGLTTVDCLKDDGIISIEEWDEEEECLGGECLFEFKQVGEDLFKLIWSDTYKRL